MSLYHQKRHSQLDALSKNKSVKSSEDEKTARINRNAENKKRKKMDAEFIDDTNQDSSEEEKPVRTIVKAKKEIRADEKANLSKVDVLAGATICKLSNLRKVVVKKFKNAILVDIREYYEDEDGNMKPSHKGISLTVSQWKTLIQNANQVEAAVWDLM